MKKLILITIFLQLAIITFSQDKDYLTEFNLSPQLAFPLGDLKITNKLGLGGSFNGGIALSEKAAIIITLEGLSFLSKHYTSPYTGDYPAIFSTMLKGGAKYYVTEGLFVIGQLGLGLNTLSGGEGRNFGFVYSPIIGYRFGGHRYDISAKYTSIRLKDKNANAAGFCIGYYF